MSRIAIVGAGAWGTGLAIVLGRQGRHSVRLWAFEPEVREAIEARHINEQFLPGQRIPESVCATGDLQEALRDAEECVHQLAEFGILVLSAEPLAPAIRAMAAHS